MQQNLNVIATISSLGTLFGLLGTVLGMIRSFGAMANEGAPDSIALSLGISEALMNTAMGITTGALQSSSTTISPRASKTSPMPSTRSASRSDRLSKIGKNLQISR